MIGVTSLFLLSLFDSYFLFPYKKFGMYYVSPVFFFVILLFFREN